MELLVRKIENDRMSTMTMKFFSFFLSFFFELSSNILVSQYSRTLKQVCTVNTPRENPHFLSKTSKRTSPLHHWTETSGKPLLLLLLFFYCSSPTHKRPRPVAAVGVMSMLIYKILRITSD